VINNLHHPRATQQRKLLAAISGLLMILATPPLPFFFIAWFGLVPYFKSLEHATSRREAFHLGFIFAFIWHAGTAYWIAWNSGLEPIMGILTAIGMAVNLAFWFGIVAIAHRWLISAYGNWAHFLAIILYVASDVVWASGEWTFPWISFSLTQGNTLQILQIASIGGGILVTGWVALLNMILVVGQRRWSSITLVVLIVASTWIWGDWREEKVFQQTHGTQLARVAIVQGNIDQEYKYDLGSYYSLNMYDGLSSANTDQDVDLIVWPENGAPVYVVQDYRWRRYLQNLVDRLDATLITGGRYADFHEDNSKTPYNAAFQIKPGGQQKFETFLKVFLVPFGERFPYQGFMPFLGDLDFGQAEFAAGEEIVVWNFPVENDTINVSPLICYEAIFPQAGWKAAHLDADLLVNMTNDGWFTGTGQQLQHLLLSRVRSVETGRSLARATNTGISAFVSPSGRIMKTLGSNQRGVITYTVETPVDTQYIRGGWRFNQLSLWAALFLIGITGIVSLGQRMKR
jgi:apolipoprotein N-acyltransferase